MARLHRTKAVNVLTFEEKTRFAHFFTLLVEIDLPKSAKTKTRKRATQKAKINPIDKKPCYIKCPAMCCFALRDLFLQTLNYLLRPLADCYIILQGLSC